MNNDTPHLTMDIRNLSHGFATQVFGVTLTADRSFTAYAIGTENPAHVPAGTYRVDAINDSDQVTFTEDRIPRSGFDNPKSYWVYGDIIDLIIE